MILLDLPPELLALVIAHLVTGAGIVEARKHRKVCRTFRRSIEREVLANQPTRAFLQPKEANARGILRHNMALYLSYRMMAEKGAYNFLPRFLKKVFDAACPELSHNCHYRKTEHARTLCRLLVKNDPKLVQRLIMVKAPETSAKRVDLTEHFSEDMLSTNIAVAAAAFGNLDSLRTALGDNIDLIWKRSPVLGHPLVVAAANGHIEVVGAIVKHFENTQHRTHMAKHEKAFSLAIGVALKELHAEVALLLLKVYNSYASPIHQETFQTWMCDSICIGNVDVIIQLRQLRHGGAWDVVDSFVEACSTDDLSVVRKYIDAGLVSLHCRYESEDGFTPIQTAVGNAKVVELLLEMGSDPNGDCVELAESRPLWLAIERSDMDSIAVLLDFGADPRHVQKLWEDASKKYRERRPGVDLALSDAKRASKYYIRPTTPRTTFAADAPDLVMPDQLKVTASEEGS